MPGILQGLICCRYLRSLRSPCYVCCRTQLWRCLQSPSGILSAGFSSSVTDRKSLLQSAKAYGRIESNLIKPIYFHKQSYLRLRFGLLQSGQCHTQLKQYYSTKKNVAALPPEEEKDSYQGNGPGDQKITSGSVKEFRKDDAPKLISKSIPEVSSLSVLSPETSLKEVSKTAIVSKIGDEKLPSRVLRYALWRFTWYLKKFQQSLENEMPDTFNMFRIFSIGLKDFVVDFKDFIKVLMVISMPGSTVRALSRRDLELYYNMPGDMLRVFPILVISSIPFGQNVAFPIGYWFPKHLLCHHFWDIKQRHDFAMLSLKKRLFNARSVFRSMQALLLTIENEVEQDKCRSVFYKLGSGIHPTPDEVVSILPLFQGHPYHIRKIRATHVNGLLRLHGKSVWLRRRHRLKDHARMIHYLDTAISREGIDSLSYDQLKASLFLRGVNPTNMSTKNMTEFLESWLNVSREVDASSYSLLLHLPILLAYNQPTNFVLIY